MVRLYAFAASVGVVLVTRWFVFVHTDDLTDKLLVPMWLPSHLAAFIGGAAVAHLTVLAERGRPARAPSWLIRWSSLAVAFALCAGLVASSRLGGPWAFVAPTPTEHSIRTGFTTVMALTLLALGWLLWRMAGDAGLMAAILGALIVGLFAFVYGRSQRQGKRLGPVLLALLVLSAAMGAMLVRGHAPVEAGKASLAGAPYSETALAAARASGKPVFVYFTADWCVTCKINEGAAINRSDTEAAFKAAGVTVLVGDWTDGNADITRALAAQGRNSVPLYLWYRPGADQPEVLPQILTVSMLTDRAKGK